MADRVVYSVFEKLHHLINYKPDFIQNLKSEIEYFFVEIGLLKNILECIEENAFEHEKAQHLLIQIRDWVCKAEDAIDLFVVNASMQEDWGVAERTHQFFNPYLNLRIILKAVKPLRIHLSEVFDAGKCDSGLPQTRKPLDEGSTRPTTSSLDEEIVIGLDNEVEMIKERLIGGRKGLQVVSVVGMPGLGKTTLARKVYSDPLVSYHFHIRVWTSISQTYRKKDTLLDILSHLVDFKTKEVGDENLGQELYRRFKGNKYLIIIDDIWDIEAWNDLKFILPNDLNGSRIVLTTRLRYLALHAGRNSTPHHMDFLPENTSWDLLRWKVFQNKHCPPKLVEIGKTIAQKCQGLPLAIVIVAGVLSQEKMMQSWWERVAGHVSSYIASDPKIYFDTLAMSYKHLPLHLKSCFLYLGAFKENREIPVEKLMWLWIAEGFIQRNGQKTLEDTAKGYLLDLVNRNMVVVARKNYSGGIKTCRFHDMMRNVCMKIGEDEIFLWRPSLSDTSSIYDIPSLTIPAMQRRICGSFEMLDFYRHPLKSHAPLVRSLLLWSTTRLTNYHDTLYSIPEDGSWILSRKDSCFIFRDFKIVRVLDLSSLATRKIPSELKYLVLLRYLAVWVFLERSPLLISDLWNLETLIVKSERCITLPHDISKLLNLRHLCIEYGSLQTKRSVSKAVNCHFEAPYPEESADNISYGSPSMLSNLQTIRRICTCISCQKILAKAPNLRELVFSGVLISESGNLTFPDLDFLVQLETLKFEEKSTLVCRSTNLDSVKWPANIKTLTLKGTTLDWEAISTIAILLPNLEALKLKSLACTGELWELSDVLVFHKLKFLNFFDLDIEVWIASSINFPCLRSLVLDQCRKLQEIPFDFVDIPTIEIIEVKSCSQSAEDSARKIKEEQVALGNNLLKINIYHQPLSVA